MTLDLVPQLRPIWLAPGTPAAFFAGLRRALRRWDRYDAIVILAPPLTTGGDARWIVPHATGAVLVVDGTRSTRRAIDAARHRRGAPSTSRARRARRCSASW